ncbi:lysophospholipid acyltransferase family protein [Maribacter sp. CXY002]|uniref:lysophospholipid acyltransferase family protein n=1 Tax=Maribacter luteocoastalis TaxID=3407671 RepID=UPI003B66F7C5
MKNFIYNSIKLIMRYGLHVYHKNIRVVGLDNVPTNKPVLFLPNHQSALLDVLLIATDCKRKPYFLARSDVFGNPWLNRIFSFFRMIPIYRIRDGRATLAKNDAIFNSCAKALNNGEAIVMFPEANHNLKRRVRNLSKGFTRVLFRALELDPALDVQIVPVGLNYKHATGFPDEVAVYYGRPIALQAFLGQVDRLNITIEIKHEVSKCLQELTTHVPLEENYDKIIDFLMNNNVDFLNPKETNELISEFLGSENLGENQEFKKKSSSIFYPFFTTLNFPIILIWRSFIKPKVLEAEFLGTFRFVTAFIGFIGYYSILLISIGLLVNINIAILMVLGIFVFNWLFVKYGQAALH